MFPETFSIFKPVEHNLDKPIHSLQKTHKITLDQYYQTSFFNGTIQYFGNEDKLYFNILSTVNLRYLFLFIKWQSQGAGGGSVS